MAPIPALFRQANRSRAQWLRRFFFEGNCLCAPSVLLRRTAVEKVGDHDARLLQLQDFDYWIRLALIGDLHVIQRPLVAYRVRTHGNVSARGPENNTRLRWESAKVLRRFLTLHDRRFFTEVFPDSTGIEGHDELPLPFLLGILAIGAADPGVRLFGVDLLFDTFGSAEERLALERKGIRPVFLFDAVKRADPFGLQGGMSVKETLKALQLGVLRAVRTRAKTRFRRASPASEK